jgi:hypothetical protein
MDLAFDTCMVSLRPKQMPVSLLNFLLSQRKLVLTAKIHFLRYRIIGAPTKLKKKWPRSLFRPRSNPTCNQKPNPSRERVP